MDYSEEKPDEKKENNIRETKKALTERMRENPWMFATMILGVVTLILLIGNFQGGMTGDVIDSDVAGAKLLAYYESTGAQGLVLESVEEENGLYKVNFEYQGAIVPIYMTQDGALAGSMNSLVVEATSDIGTDAQEVPKLDKPKVELFVWSYCPYGVQAQGPMAEVVSLLGDAAEFVIVPYYDGHGEYEAQQNKIQSCIQKLDTDKYWAYAAGFVEDIYDTCGSTRDAECDKSESIKLMDSLGIDSDEVIKCVDSEGDDLFEEAVSYSRQNGVQGSPTILVNGVKVSVARNAESIKAAVCEAFNDAPSECSEVLDSSAAAAAGNC